LKTRGFEGQKREPSHRQPVIGRQQTGRIY
jgi:hypothetical protein